MAESPTSPVRHCPLLPPTPVKENAWAAGFMAGENNVHLQKRFGECDAVASARFNWF